MNKLILLFIITCLFSFINTTCTTDENDTYKYRDYKDCKNREFDFEEIEDNAYKCCHIEIEIESANVEHSFEGCIPVTKNQYYNIRQLVRQYEAKANVDDVDIDCNSSYVKFYIISLIIFLL